MKTVKHIQYFLKNRHKAINTIALISFAVAIIIPSLAIAASPAASLPFTDPHPQSGNEFGYAVSLSQDGTVAVVTAPQETDSSGNTSAGAAYVFLNNAGSWNQNPLQLTINNPLPNNDFGNSAYITPDGSKIIVGAFNPKGGQSGGNGQTGQVYIFNEPSGGWANAGSSLSQSAELQANTGIGNSLPGDNFGSSVALSADGNTAIVGAQYYNS